MNVLRTVRFRLTCWYSAALGFVLVGFGLLLFLAVRYQSLHHHDDALRATADDVLSILAQEPDCATLKPAQVGDLDRLAHLVLVHELAGVGQIFYRSRDLDPALLPRGEAEIRELLSRPEAYQVLDRDGESLRVYSVRYTTRTGRLGAVRAIDSLGNTAESLKTLRWSLLIMVPLSLLAAGSGGYWLAGRALRPVDEVTRLAREIGASNLRRRLPMTGADDELGRLVTTFNQMIDRLEAGFESMRQFTADASHELKTPLAIMRASIDVTLVRDRTSDEYHETLADLLQEVDRMTRLVEDLLFLARTDASALEMRQMPTRLDEVAAEVVEAMQPVATGQQVTVSVTSATAVEVEGDGTLLRQMLCNLVDNAIKHGGAGGAVQVAVEQREGIALMSVSDAGSGIPKEERERVFERFFRVDTSRSRDKGGVGLGLSIARRVARLHGGDIEIESREGKGSTFLVNLPLHRVERAALTPRSDS